MSTASMQSKNDMSKSIEVAEHEHMSKVGFRQHLLCAPDDTCVHLHLHTQTKLMVCLAKP